MQSLISVTLAFLTGVLAWANAQTLRRDTDTVVMGAGYRYQVYYRLSDGRQDTALRCSWHLAFEVPIRGAAIRANHPCGVTVYKTTRDTSGWEQLSLTDTVHPLYDDLCQWSVGAFNVTASSSPFDVGWGVYNLNDHITRGDSLFIVQVGNTFKKLWIRELRGADYIIRVANIDGSQDTTYAVNKSIASGRNFVYLNLLTHEVLNLEPASQDWDLLFTQYSKLLPAGPNQSVRYNLTGVLLNLGVRAARVVLSSQANPDTLTLSAYPLDSCISVIGDDWKRFDTQTMQWYLADTLYFLVQDRADNLWRIRFIGFGGSATGVSVVEKVRLRSGAVALLSTSTEPLRVYPQPAREGIYVGLPVHSTAEVALYTLTGQKLFTTTTQGETTLYLPRPSIPAGLYVLQVRSGTNIWTQRVIFE